MTHFTCRLTAKNRDQLRNPTLGNRVWATFIFFSHKISLARPFCASSPAAPGCQLPPSSLLSFGYATAHQREAPNRREKSDDYDCCAVCCSVPAAAEAALLRLVVWIRFLPPLISFPFSAFRWLSLFSSYFLTFFPFSSCPFPLLPCLLFHPFPSPLHFSLFPFHSPLLISSFLSLTLTAPSFYIAVLFFGVE